MQRLDLAQAQAAQTQEFPTWEQMSLVEQLHATWWDVYKEAHGFRPRGVDVGHWTAEDFRDEIKELGEIIEQAERARREDEHRAVLRFNKRVEEVIKSGAGDRETALRWIMEADQCNGDWEYLAWSNGLPYGFFRKTA